MAHRLPPRNAGSPERVVDYRIVRAPSWDTRWSDHAPVVADAVLTAAGGDRAPASTQ
jgi:hypothetical protein